MEYRCRGQQSSIQEPALTFLTVTLSASKEILENSFTTGNNHFLSINALLRIVLTFDSTEPTELKSEGYCICRGRYDCKETINLYFLPANSDYWYCTF